MNKEKLIDYLLILFTVILTIPILIGIFNDYPSAEDFFINFFLLGGLSSLYFFTLPLITTTVLLRKKIKNKSLKFVLYFSLAEFIWFLLAFGAMIYGFNKYGII